MPKYRVFYLKDELSRRFRDLPAAAVRKQLKPKNYTMAGEIEAPNDYAAWQALQAPEAALPGAKIRRPFGVGDVLEREEAKPLLCLFGGFEEAAWWTPEQAATLPAGEAPSSDASAPQTSDSSAPRTQGSA